MAEKVKTMLKNNMVLCVLILTGIGLTSVMFAADFKIKTGAVEEGIVFGSWTTVDNDGNNLSTWTTYQATYQATSDGFVIAFVGGNSEVKGGSGADINNIDWIVFNSSSNGSSNSITMPVKKGYYWRIGYSGSAPTIRWIPLGNGGAPVKQ